MNKSLLKILPLIAAVTIATSCSKDDDTNAAINGRDGVHTVSTTEINAIPYTIKVATGKKISKIAYANSTDKQSVTPTFEDGDVGNLTMTITGDGITPSTLTLEKVDGTFFGTLNVTGSPTTLTATINVSGVDLPYVSSNSEDLFDVMSKCAHTYTGKFTYGTNEVQLTDQNVYVSISSPMKEIDLNGEKNVYQMDNGNLYVALSLEDGKFITSLALGLCIKPEPGTVYRVTRHYQPKAFSVSATKTVIFSCGNLQYHPEYKQWRFAPHQYNICHKAGDKVGTNYEDWKTWTDLFGWGAWIQGQIILNTSETPSAYTPVTDENNVLTGSPAISTNWTTLTTTEFQYLLGDNDKRNNKFGVAQVAGIKGMILLPDDWTKTPDGVTEFKPGTNTNFAYEEQNNYSAESWAKMESAGAVFFPVAGYREGSSCIVGTQAHYHSSLAYDDHRVYLVYFTSRAVYPDYYYHSEYGYSVRLVRAF